MALRVGIDAANLLRDRRGIGRYVTALLRSWIERFSERIEPVLVLPHLLPAAARRAVQRRLEMPAPAISGPRGSLAASVAVLWYPWNGMTWESAAPAVVTVHDLWPFVAPAPDARRRAREQSHYRLAAARARRFIAVSRFTAEQLVEYLGVGADRIDVIPHGIAPLRASAVPVPESAGGAGATERSASTRAPYVLFVGEAEPRKDLGSLVDAMQRLPQGLRSHTRLVVAGKRGPQRIGAPDGVRVEWLGHVSDACLGALYGGASAFVLPSRYEGFGLPVLEAMAHGAPVIASSAGALREAGGDAALYFPAGDAEALSSALARVLSDRELASQLSEAGLRRAAAMSVDRCALRTIEVFERVAKG